jgi:hypothetical protein
MKTLSVVTVAILLGLSGAAMAGGDSESQQDSTNSTGPNPFMPEFSTPVIHGDPDTWGYRPETYAGYPNASSAYGFVPSTTHHKHHSHR